MGIPTARFSLLTGGGKIPDHDNEDGHSGGDHDHVDDHIRWQLLGCLECTPKNYIAANMYQVSQKAYSSHILTC